MLMSVKKIFVFAIIAIVLIAVDYTFGQYVSFCIVLNLKKLFDYKFGIAYVHF